MGQVGRDIEIKTVSQDGPGHTRRPGVSMSLTFDSGAVVRSSTWNGDASFAIPAGARKITGIAVEVEWTTVVWKGISSETSGNTALKWAVDVPLSDMGMDAPDR